MTGMLSTALGLTGRGGLLIRGGVVWFKSDPALTLFPRLPWCKAARCYWVLWARVLRGDSSYCGIGTVSPFTLISLSELTLIIGSIVMRPDRLVL